MIYSKRKQFSKNREFVFSVSILLVILVCLNACETDIGNEKENDKNVSNDDADAGSDTDTDTGSDTDADGDSDGGGPDIARPVYDEVESYETVIPGNDDPADVCYPNPPGLADGDYSFPVVLMMSGANVKKMFYTGFGTTLASYGFIVIIPSHLTKIMGLSGLMVEQYLIHDVLSFIKSENENTDSPIAGKIDTSILMLTGHSHGGMCSMNAIREICQIPCCQGSFTRPPELKGAALWGTTLAVAGVAPKTMNQGIPIALIQGTVDGMANPGGALATYEKIQDPPKAFIGVAGANHYGQCDVNNPQGAIKDTSTPTIDQDVAVETIARWSAIWLMAHVLGNEDALKYVHETGSDLDENINIRSEQ